jgi:hypothetical protein
MARRAHKEKRKKSARSVVRKYWLLGPVLAGAGILGWLITGPRWFGPRALSAAGAPIKGYIGGIETVQKEYQRFHGKPLKNPAVERLFKLASERIAAKDYEAAALLLETVSQDAAVPVVFNDLGVLYAQLNDRSRAINSFRDALARDMDYLPVRENLARLRYLSLTDAADPVTREIEPNNSPRFANVIVAGKPVDGEIAAGVGDLDYFRFTSPPAPRDVIQIAIEARSPELSPMLRIYDSEKRLTEMAAESQAAGETLTFTFSPAPNTTFYLEISGKGGSAGKYTLKVVPQRAFDNYEPNDDILNARRIEIAHTITANIMDARDTDFYSFIAPRSGAVTVAVRNQSSTLIPALTTFAPDLRNMGFGPDVRTPGAHLRHSFDVVENQTYYLQVWSANNTTGEYTLTIE